MAISVSPGRRSSPGFCHNRRQGKRSAQKQIICPTYRGSQLGGPYRLGSELRFFAPAARMRAPQSLKADSLLEGYLITANLAGHLAGLGPAGRLRRTRVFGGKAEKAAYSAARASEAFGFAAEIMKSWMRGTISDLKREPLNTP